MTSTMWTGRYARRLTAQTLASKGTLCHLCRTDGADSADHLIPRSKGGPDTLENLAPSHRTCNSARGDMPLEEWFVRHPVPHRPALAPSRAW